MIIIDLIFALGFISLKNILPTYYIQDVDVIETASFLIIIAGFFQLSDGIQVVVLGALRGLQDVKVPMGITFIAYWVIGFPIKRNGHLDWLINITYSIGSYVVSSL